MRAGVNHINKQEFLPAYMAACSQALSANNIKAAFAAAGLIPYDLDQVLSGLQTSMGVTTPPAQDLQANWVLETPHNLPTLQMQAESIKQSLNKGSRSPPSSAERAIAQVIKGCKMALHGSLILAEENKQLREENARQKRKRAQRHIYIGAGGLLTIAEGSRWAEEANKEAEEIDRVEEARRRQPRQPPRCSRRNSLSHKAPGCPSLQETRS
jgi:hypothetical protein